MIFKSEGEPKIQRMATAETPPVISDPGAPFDYRAEITNEDIARFQAEYASAERAFVEGTENYVPTNRFLDICAAMKQLDLVVPPLSTAAEKKVLTMLTHALKSVGIASDEIRLLINIQLYDPNLFNRLSWLARRNFETFFAYLEKINSASGLNVGELAFLFLARRSEKAIIPDMLAEAIVNKRLIDLGWGIKSPHNLGKFLRERAYARIIGITNVPPLRSEDWNVIRDAISSTNDPEEKEHATQNRAHMMLQTRIINAKEISIDENGLHIVDPDPEVVSKAKSDTPLPARKNI